MSELGNEYNNLIIIDFEFYLSLAKEFKYIITYWEDGSKKASEIVIWCSRYNRNCSILKKAKEGRIQKEISELICNKYKKRKND